MRLLSQTLCLCLALALSLTAADHHEKGEHEKQHCHAGHCHDIHIDRCEGIEMDAVAVNEEGIPYFFHDHHLFKGFHDKVEHSNETFAEMDDDHHLGHVDAAIHMHHDDHDHHEHMLFFLDDKVFSYHQHKLEDGFPKSISEVFPGIPEHLDAAVECPMPECDEDSVIFFKAHQIYLYNVRTKAVEEKVFEGMPNCTSALRFMEHYYCFHGHLFSKFDPKTGEVHGRYPKEARGYFMSCPEFGDHADHVERERCSHVDLDAIISANAGSLCAFRGHHFLYKDAGNDSLWVGTVESVFKELHGEVDAVFSYEDHLYMVKDEQVFVYSVGEPHTLLEGYPKALKEELGIEGPINAAFVCEPSNIAHIIKGQNIYDVDMNASPRAAANERSFTLFKKVDAAMCGPEGITLVVGNHFYKYPSVMVMVSGRVMAPPHRLSSELFGCDH